MNSERVRYAELDPADRLKLSRQAVELLKDRLVQSEDARIMIRECMANTVLSRFRSKASGYFRHLRDSYELDFDSALSIFKIASYTPLIRANAFESGKWRVPLAAPVKCGSGDDGWRTCTTRENTRLLWSSVIPESMHEGRYSPVLSSLLDSRPMIMTTSSVALPLTHTWLKHEGGTSILVPDSVRPSNEGHLYTRAAAFFVATSPRLNQALFVDYPVGTRDMSPEYELAHMTNNLFGLDLLVIRVTLPGSYQDPKYSMMPEGVALEVGFSLYMAPTLEHDRTLTFEPYSQVVRAKWRPSSKLNYPYLVQQDYEALDAYIEEKIVEPYFMSTGSFIPVDQQCKVEIPCA